MDARTKQLTELRDRLEVAGNKLPDYSDPKWAAQFEVLQVVKELIRMALRKAL